MAQEQLQTNKKRTSKKVFKGCGCGCLVAIILFLVLGIIGTIFDDNSQDNSTENTKVETPKNLKVSKTKHNQHIDIPPLTTRVMDLTNILSSKEKEEITKTIRSFENKTLGQFAVLLIPTLNGEDIAEFGIRLMDKWQVGKKGKDNGLILIIAVNDRKRRIEVGYGYEGKITDARAGDILRATNVKMKKNDYKGAIISIITQAKDFIVSPTTVKKHKPLFRTRTNKMLGNLSTFIAVLITSLIIAIVCIISGKQLLYGTRKELKKTHKDKYYFRLLVHAVWLIIAIGVFCYMIIKTQNEFSTLSQKRQETINDQTIKSIFEVNKLHYQKEFIEHLVTTFNEKTSGNIKVLTVGSLPEEANIKLQSSLNDKTKSVILLIDRSKRTLDIFCSPDWSSTLSDTKLKENTNKILNVKNDGTGAVYAIETLQKALLEDETVSRVKLPFFSNIYWEQFFMFLGYLLLGLIVAYIIGAILFQDKSTYKGTRDDIDDDDEFYTSNTDSDSYSGGGGSAGGGGASDSW